MSEVEIQRTFKERVASALCHLGAIMTVIPLAGILVPFVLWQIFKGESNFIDAQGKEAFNFQMTLLIARIPSYVLCVVGIGVVLIAVIEIISIVFCIIAAVRTIRGKDYQYPYRFRFVK